MYDKIVKGDCLYEIKKMGNNSIDLALYSPPYWDFITYTDGNEKDMGRRQSLKEYLMQMGKIISECYRVLKDDRHMCIIIRDMTKNRQTYPLHSYMISLSQISGFVLEDIKYILLLAHAHYDYALILRKGNPRFGAVMRDKYDEPFWDLRKHSERNKHPASFISMIPRILIGKLSLKGETVLDPFCGSGTTCRIASDMDRHYIGIEISEEFYRMAINNLKKKNKDLSDFCR